MQPYEIPNKAFSDDTNTGGEFTVYAAGEAGVFDSVRSDIEAGGRPVGSDGLQTFGGVRALARYVKIEATPSIGGTIGITEASTPDLPGNLFQMTSGFYLGHYTNAIVHAIFVLCFIHDRMFFFVFPLISSGHMRISIFAKRYVCSPSSSIQKKCPANADISA